MICKNHQLIPEDNLNKLTKSELLEELETAKTETIKYANKFLELEEKWSFINYLLKKLNSIREKKQLCKAICEGFTKLSNYLVCACFIFNQDRNEIELREININSKAKEEDINKLLVEINKESINLLEQSADIELITKYFKSISGKGNIFAPITYNKDFLGYLALIKNDKTFYDDNIRLVGIITEHIALILENISLYEESEKQNKRKIEFLAGISHEFKTPLNSIIGFSEVLKAQNKDKKIFKYLDNISQSSKHLLTLIQDVLDVSRSEYKNLELDYSTFSPKEVINTITLTLENMIKEKDIELKYTLVDINITADAKRFRQLIYNFFSNAIKFNKQGGKISIFTYVKDNNFFFEITDTGDGISKKNYEKMFDFFSQVNSNQLKRQLGSGVGLALCKRITNAHNGQIGFDSKLKKGSCFWFSLPIKPITE